MTTTERIYQDDQGDWFFHLRGEQSAGPFVNFDEAEWELNKFIKSKNDLFTRPILAGFMRLIGRAPSMVPIYRQSA